MDDRAVRREIPRGGQPQAAAVGKRRPASARRRARRALADHLRRRAALPASAAANSSAGPDVPALTSTTTGSVTLPSPRRRSTGMRTAPFDSRMASVPEATNSRAAARPSAELADGRVPHVDDQARRRPRGRGAVTLARSVADMRAERGDAQVSDAGGDHAAVTSTARRGSRTRSTMCGLGGVAAEDHQRDRRPRRAAEQVHAPSNAGHLAGGPAVDRADEIAEPQAGAFAAGDPSRTATIRR